MVIEDFTIAPCRGSLSCRGGPTPGWALVCTDEEDSSEDIFLPGAQEAVEEVAFGDYTAIYQEIKRRTLSRRSTAVLPHWAQETLDEITDDEGYQSGSESDVYEMVGGASSDSGDDTSFGSGFLKKILSSRVQSPPDGFKRTLIKSISAPLKGEEKSDEEPFVHPMANWSDGEESESKCDSTPEPKKASSPLEAYHMVSYSVAFAANAILAKKFTWEIATLASLLMVIIFKQIEEYLKKRAAEGARKSEIADPIWQDTPYGAAMEVFDLEWFYEASKAAKESQKYGACVTIFTVKQLVTSGARLFVSNNGGAFAAVTSKGELINVVRHKQNSTSADFHAVMTAAICGGANFLECMDTIITPVYMQCGFVPIAKAEWNDNFAPHDWDKDLFAAYNNGEPCYVYMVWAGLDRYRCIQETRPSYDPTLMSCRRSKFGDMRQMDLVRKFHKYTPQKVAGADELVKRSKKKNAA